MIQKYERHLLIWRDQINKNNSCINPLEPLSNYDHSTFVSTPIKGYEKYHWEVKLTHIGVS